MGLGEYHKTPRPAGERTDFLHSEIFLGEQLRVLINLNGRGVG